jgi:hypothetical protein
MTLSTGGFRQVVAFPPAPIATGWSDPCRKGLAPSQEPCLSTAHGHAFGSNPPYTLRLFENVATKNAVVLEGRDP